MHNIFKIVHIAKPLYRLLLVLTFLVVVGALLELTTPLLSKFIVDEIISKIQGHSGEINKLIFLVFLAFLANLLNITLTALTERQGDKFASRLRKFLTEKFYDKILTLPNTYFDSKLSGKMINQLNRSLASIQIFTNSASNFIAPLLLQTVFTVILLSYFNLLVGFLSLLLFPIYIFISYQASKRWREEEIKKNAIEDISRGRIQEVVGNIKLVKSFNTEKEEFDYLSSTLSEVNRIYDRQSKNYHIFNFARNLSLILILLAISVIVFKETFSGNMSLGTMVLIIQLVNQIRRPLFSISHILTSIQTAEAGSKDYFEILGLPSKENYKERTNLAKVVNPVLRFSNVSFSYPSSGKILKNISFKIEDNEKVALVGHSGTGKTTLVNLILQFYDPSSGQIFLNNKSYRSLSSAFIRNNISLVFQDNELFSNSIAENIRYGNPKTNENEVIEALKKANAWDFVSKLPEGLDTKIGERGVRLSGGQKQRIQIARAILKDAPILILDEATSSLDAKSENSVQNALDNLMRNKLVIIIAHRFSTITNVDRIIVLDQGRIVETGKPKDLIKNEGIYSDLLKHQIDGTDRLMNPLPI